MAAAKTAGQQASAEAIVDAEDLGASVMLLGSLCCTVAAVSLAHHPVEGVRLGAWRLLDSALSTGLAALLAQACSVALAGGCSLPVEVVFGALQTCLAFGLMHLLLARSFHAGAAGGGGAASVEVAKLQMRSCAALLGRVVAFSTVDALGVLQLAMRTWPMRLWTRDVRAVALARLGFILGVVPVGATVLSLSYGAVRCARCSAAAGAQGLVLSPLARELESEWLGSAREAERWSVGISSSFLLVQSLQHAAEGGQAEFGLPERSAGPVQTYQEALSLAAAAGTLGALAASRRAGRARPLLASASGWCALRGLDRGLACAGGRAWLGGADLACAYTAVALALAMPLGRWCQGGEAQRASELVEALGVPLGYAWERAVFEALGVAAGVADATGGWTPSAPTWQALALALFAAVLPAWRLHALPRAPRPEERRAARPRPVAAPPPRPPGAGAEACRGGAGGAAPEGGPPPRAPPQERPEGRGAAPGGGPPPGAPPRAALERGRGELQSGAAALEARLLECDALAPGPAGGVQAPVAPVVTTGPGDLRRKADRPPPSLIQTMERLTDEHDAVEAMAEEQLADLVSLQATVMAETLQLSKMDRANAAMKDAVRRRVAGFERRLAAAESL